MNPSVLFGIMAAALTAFGPASPAATRDASAATRVLWRDPGSVAQRDLFWGAGDATRAPKPPFKFVREDTSGSKPKIDVTDANGVAWSVKFATPDPAQNEVHAEIAAGRLLWAFGYLVDEHYFVPEGRIDGAKDLKRAAAVVTADGSFKVARFERRPPNVVMVGPWTLEEKNPFVGTRELSGLQILTVLIGNWDATPLNAAILRVPLPNGDQEERYLLSDLGSAFGRMKGGAGKTPTRWNIADYTEARFVGRVVQNRLEFRHPIMGNAPLAIPIAHARWFVGMLSQLTEAQIQQAFHAAGASALEVDQFSNQVARRIGDLKSALDSK